VAVSPDNSYMLYEDIKAPENEWRKHHTSSASRDVWMYDLKTGKHTNMSNHAGEDRNPVISADGKSMLFLSERDGGSMNVYMAPFDNPSAVKALTNFKEHPVRFLSQGSDGTVAMSYDGEIYTVKPGQKPVKVKVDIVEDSEDPISYLAVAGNANGGVPSPDNKMVAFTRRGDVFVTSVEYKTTKQITSTPQAEGSITWGSDNRTLYYVSERDGYPTIYSATIERESDPDFPNATTIKEEALWKSENGVERTYPQVSPDGKKLAFVQNRNKLMVMDLKTKKVKQITDGSVNPSRMDLDYQWSPDSKWLAFTMNDNRHDPYYNIGLVNVDGEPKVLNLTNDGYFDMDMRWSADG
ncbi:MAG: DPP IV N-terminal domain-containing protein, partial [Muribaculaceae bacterium]|nr:DPP IV N-terminal domain-containing protein [Muribaculaceae bacterium]